MLNNRTLIICLTTVSLAIIGSMTFLFLAVEDGARLESLLSIIVPQLGLLGANVLVLLRQGSVRDHAENARINTDKLLNGEGQRKIENGVRRVLEEMLAERLADNEKDTNVTGL